MKGNVLITTHEQAGAQHALEGLVDLDVGDDGWFRGLVGEPGVYIMGEGSDEQFATNRMELRIPGADGEPVRITVGVPQTASPVNNLVIDDSLLSDLNPDGDTGIDIGDITVDFGDGRGDVTLPDIAGWGDEVPDLDMEAFPTDPTDWYDATGGSTDTANWADENERMWFIVNLFQQIHTDPALFDALDTIAAQTGPGGSVEYLSEVLGS